MAYDETCGTEYRQPYRRCNSQTPYYIGLVKQAHEYHLRCLSPGPIYDRLFYRNERGACQERWWPRFKEIDFRDSGLREVARHTTVISGCFAGKKTLYYLHIKETEYQVYGYWQRSGLGHIGR